MKGLTKFKVNSKCSMMHNLFRKIVQSGDLNLRRFFLVLFIICLFAPHGLVSHAFAGDEQTVKEVRQNDVTEKSLGKPENISFNSYIKLINEKLPELKSNRIALLQAENEINRSKSTGDVNLSAGGESYRNNTYSGINDKGNVNGYNFYGGLSKTLTGTGTDVELKYNYDKYSYKKFSTINDYTAHNPSLTLKVTQPLLYNFLGKVSSYSEKNAKLQYEIEKIKLQENNKSTLNSYKKLYFQWILYKEILKELSDAINNSKKLAALTARRYKAGLSDNDDYQAARVSVYGYEVQYREYQNSLKAIENQMSLYFSVRNNMPLKEEFEKFYDLSNKIKFETVDFSRTKSAEIIRKTMMELSYSKSVYRNMLLPQLNVYGQIAGENMSQEYSSDLKDRDYSVGFEFTYPLGNHSAQSSLKDIELEIKSLNHEYEETLNSYRKNLWNYVSESGNLKERLVIKSESQKALKSQLDTEKTKYRQARVTLSDLIDTQNSLTSGEIDMLGYKYSLICCYIDYMDLTDQGR